MTALALSFMACGHRDAPGPLQPSNPNADNDLLAAALQGRNTTGRDTPGARPAPAAPVTTDQHILEQAVAGIVDNDYQPSQNAPQVPVRRVREVATEAARAQQHAALPVVLAAPPRFAPEAADGARAFGTPIPAVGSADLRRLGRRVRFSGGSYAIAASESAVLDGVAAALRTTTTSVVVFGFADDISDNAGAVHPAPAELARRRAEIVVIALGNRHISRSRLRASGIVLTTPETGMDRNRNFRAEIMEVRPTATR